MSEYRSGTATDGEFELFDNADVEEINKIQYMDGWKDVMTDGLLCVMCYFAVFINTIVYPEFSECAKQS